MSRCPLCGGEKESATTTFVVDRGTNLIVVRETPATVCKVCGEEWIDDMTVDILEDIVSEAVEKKRMIEVVDFSLEKAA